MTYKLLVMDVEKRPYFTFILLAVCVFGAKAAGVPDNTPPMYDTIVVGLGASGTMAATTLARAGRRVLALEAQDRVGGRVNTVNFGDGVVELGAEWIHGEKPNRVYDMAIRNNVSILSQDISMQAYRSDGSKADNDLVNELVTFALDVVDDPPETAQPLGEYITARLLKYIDEKHPALKQDQDFITEVLAFIDLVIDNYEATTSWNDVTTESNYTHLEGDQNLSWHRYGYKTLFEIMMNTYNNGPGLPTLEYKLNSEVTLIQWPRDSDGHVVVTCKDGGVYTADNVIVTVSVGVLKERYESLFSPPLPQTKVDSIHHIQIGVAMKILLEFTEHWFLNATGYGFIWRGEDRRKEEYVWTKVQTAARTMGASNVISLWATGDHAIVIESLPDDVVKRKSMELLRRFMGANITIPEPVNMLRSSWHSNPFTRGSYTYDHVDSPKYPTARLDLAAPLMEPSGKPRVLFAGEATDSYHFSTVHGAVDSGHREAVRLLPGSKI